MLRRPPRLLWPALATLSALHASCATGSPPAVSIAPGFAPAQPMTLTGLAGGAHDARALAEGCTGSVPISPQHVLSTTAALSNLTVMVQGHGADTTLAVRLPDGRFLCSDDAEGTNPLVRSAVGPGRVEIYVGAYSTASISAPYTLALTEDPDALPSAIP